MNVTILQGDACERLRTMEARSVQCVVTSPPYWGLRDYGSEGQIGNEDTFADFISRLLAVFAEVHRVMKDDGTLWLNMGDSYAGTGKSGFKNKDLIGQPWRLAFALQDAGWYLRSDIIWHKPNPMPESVLDRPTRSHEYLFLLTKSPRYYYDAAAIRNPPSEALVKQINEGYSGSATKDFNAANVQDASAVKQRIIENARKRLDRQRGHSRRHAGFNDRWDQMTGAEQRALGSNARTVWTIATKGYKGAHFATFPPELPTRCILAGSRAGDTVLDPFAGSGTTAEVALGLGRSAVAIELNPDYVVLIRERCGLFAEVAS